jgi:hypothetical protein
MRHIALLFALSGCWVSADTAETAAPVDTPPTDFSDCDPAAGDPIDITAASIDAETLTVAIGHSGGCADHTYVLCWPDQAFAESSPVQAHLGIQHDAHGDSCEAYLTSELTFDLSPLREAYAEAYGAVDGGVIDVHVDDQSASYVF